MANINIANLPTTGLDLFSDSESYLKELSDQQLNLQVSGGSGVVIIIINH